MLIMRLSVTYVDGGRPVYIGETSRNLYTRGKEHMRSETGKAQKRGKLGSPINTWSSTIKVWRVGLGRRSQKQTKTV